MSELRIVRHRFATTDRLGFKVVDEHGAMKGRPSLHLQDVEMQLVRLENEAQRAQLVQRPCISCSKPFESEGIHNRMCPYCRHRANDAGMI